MGINSSRVRGNFKPSNPISRQSIMSVRNYTFGDANKNVIDNIDTVIKQTIAFLTALKTQVIEPIMKGTFVESDKSKDIAKYLLTLKLIKFDEIEVTDSNGKTSVQKQYRFVSSSYREKVSNADNIGMVYYNLITQYITLLNDLGPYYSGLILGDLMTDNDDNKDINSMKNKINAKLTKMTNYIKFFHYDSYIVDYSRYVYMIYAIQMFKDLDDIYDMMKIQTDLATVDTNINFKSYGNENNGKPMDDELRKLSELINEEGRGDVEIIDLKAPIPKQSLQPPPQPLQPPQPPQKPGLTFTNQNGNQSTNAQLSQGQPGFVQQEQEKLNFGIKGGNTVQNTVQVTINKLKTVFENREKEFKEDREALVVFFNTVNGIIKKASDEVKEIYRQKYRNILTDKTIVFKLNDISNKISNNTNKLSQVFDGVPDGEKQNLAGKIGEIIGEKGKNIKVTDRDLGILVTLNKKIRDLNQQTESFLNPVQ